MAAATSEAPRGFARWLIAIMGTILMICLGTVYAWSYFQSMLVQSYGWSNSQVAWIFALAIFFLGLTAAWGGTRLPRIGPRKMAVAGGIAFGAGYAVAAFALSIRSLPLLYLGYGAIGGTGLGLGYVTPVATVAKWFPDKKGFATGLVVMGFGFGALFMSKILAPALLGMTGNDLVRTFLILAGIFLILTVVPAAFLRNPPSSTASASAAPADPARKHVLTGRFALIWFVFFCNITAGISIISFQSPLFQDLWKRIDPTLSAAALGALGATLIAVSSLFNGAGRFLWGALSDRIGRVRTFRIMLVTEIAAFGLLIVTGSPWLFGALVCYVLLCYGGGFGTMPSFISDVFGASNLAPVYGAVLTAWAAAGIVGPQIVALIKDAFPANASMYSFIAGTAFLVAGLVVSLVMRPAGGGDSGNPAR